MERGFSVHRKSSKIRWTPDEDHLLAESIEHNGTANWTLVAQALPRRSGKQCRERWVNQLNPQLKSEVWSGEEDQALLSLVMVHGHHWSMITKFLPGRSVNSIKNRFGFLSRHVAGSALGGDQNPDVTHAPLFAEMTSDRAMAVQKVRLPPIDLLPLGASAARQFTMRLR
jgi:hypothetical protein